MTFISQTLVCVKTEAQLAEDREKKLKELEKSLAKELDQEVNLSDPKDARLSEDVDLNPELQTKPDEENEDSKSSQSSGEEEKKEESNAPAEDSDEVALDNLDDMFGDDDDDEEDSDDFEVAPPSVDEPKPLTQEELDAQLMSEFGSLSKLQAILDKILAPFMRFLDPLRPLIDKAYNFYLDFGDHVRKFASWGIPQFKQWFRRFVVGFLEKLKSQFRFIFKWIKEQVLLFKNWPLNKKLMLLLLIGVVTTLVYVLPNWYRLVPVSKHPRVLRSYADIDTILILPKDYDMINVDIADEKLKYVYLVGRIAANILPSEGSSSRPMALLEFYVETTTRGAAVEVQKRETEIRDYATRTLETMTFRELNGEIGKSRYRARIRNHLNRILNTGQVKRIYFKRYQMKK